MIRIKDKEGLTFDDVILEPKKSFIRSRFSDEISVATRLLPDLTLQYPIISANMDSVSEIEMANTMHNLGGLGIIHRFMSKEKQYEQLKKLNGYRIGCVGVGESGLERAKFINSLCHGFLIDIAHGHSYALILQAEKLKKEFGKPIIAGNIATAEAALDLVSAGIHSVKAGVGPGSLCTTRIQTGCGVPQLSAIDEIYLAIDEWYKGKNCFRPTIIADGGIRSGGDIIKSLAAGADAVMVGRMFAGTYEAPGSIISVPGRGKMKIYQGMSSRSAQESWKGKATSIEGEMTLVPYQGNMAVIFENLINNIKSGMSYQNACNIKELRENAVFVRQSAAGTAEAKPHALK